MKSVKLWTSYILLCCMLLAAGHQYVHYFAAHSDSHLHETHEHDHNQVAHDCALCLLIVQQQVDFHPPVLFDLTADSFTLLTSSGRVSLPALEAGFSGLKCNKDPPYLYAT